MSAHLFQALLSVCPTESLKDLWITCKMSLRKFWIIVSIMLIYHNVPFLLINFVKNVTDNPRYFENSFTLVVILLKSTAIWTTKIIGKHMDIVKLCPSPRDVTSPLFIPLPCSLYLVPLFFPQPFLPKTAQFKKWASARSRTWCPGSLFQYCIQFRTVNTQVLCSSASVTDRGTHVSWFFAPRCAALMGECSSLRVSYLGATVIAGAGGDCVPSWPSIYCVGRSGTKRLAVVIRVEPRNQTTLFILTY